MTEPVVRHLSVRFEAMHRHGQMKWERPKDMGIAIVLYLDFGGQGLMKDMKEYGHAVVIGREKLEEILKGEEVFIYEQDLNNPALQEARRIPCAKI